MLRGNRTVGTLVACLFPMCREQISKKISVLVTQLAYHSFNINAQCHIIVESPLDGSIN